VLNATTAIGLDNSETLPIMTTEVRTLVIVNDNSIKGMSSVREESKQEEILRSEDINWVLDEEVKYGNLIRCLIKCESGYNPNATGDSGLAFGILQFHKQTFDTYSEKYKMELDYKNPVHQIVLCDKMLTENYDNVLHWTCYSSCK
jgi:hypothetical protein